MNGEKRKKSLDRGLVFKIMILVNLSLLVKENSQGDKRFKTIVR